MFQNVYIPRTLDEVDSHEVDVAMIRKGENPDLLYKTVTGLDLMAVMKEEIPVEESVDGTSGDSESEESNSEEDEERVKTSHLKKHEDKDDKKERKRLTKDAKKAKRAIKMPKKVKKQHTSKKS